MRSLIECYFQIAFQARRNCEEVRNQKKLISDNWIVKTLADALNHYPSGITLCVVLTDLQSKW